MPVASRAPLSLRVRSHKMVGLPATLPPGLVHFRDTGGTSFYVYRSRGTGLKGFVRDFNSDTPNGLLKNFASVNHVLAHTDTYAALSAGTYFFVDGGTFPIKSDWVSSVEVRGTASNAAPPASAESVSVHDDDELSVPDSISPGKPVRIDVASAHEQVLYLFPVKSSVSAGTIAKFERHPDPDDYDTLGGDDPIELATPGGHSVLTVTFRAKPGAYELVNNAYGTNGKLYFEAGQARLITVSR